MLGKMTARELAELADQCKDAVDRVTHAACQEWRRGGCGYNWAAAGPASMSKPVATCTISLPPLRTEPVEAHWLIWEKVSAFPATVFIRAAAALGGPDD